MQNPPTPEADLEARAKGERLFNQIAEKLEGSKGMVLLVEPNAGVFFTGKTLGEATRKAREQYPHAVLYGGIIGGAEIPVYARPEPLSVQDMYAPAVDRHQALSIEDLFDPAFDRHQAISVQDLYDPAYSRIEAAKLHDSGRSQRE